MVSGRWSSRTTMLFSHCVKTGVAFDQIQFATEFHDESESSSRRAWLGTLNFEKSTIRQLNWSWLHQTLEKAQVFLPNEVLYCRCLITNNKEHCIDWISSHTTMQSRWVFILNPEGKYHGMISIMRSSTRSKRTKWYSQCTPDTTSRYKFFRQLPWCGAPLWKFSSGLIQADRIKMSHSKDSKFWTLADR